VSVLPERPSSRSAGGDPVATTEQWFLRQGLPYFVPAQRAAARAALRPRRTVPLLVGTVVAAVLVTLLVAWVASDDQTVAPATLTLVAVLAAVAYGVTALRAGPIVRWALQRTLGSVRLLVPTVTRALPLLLLFVTFLFISTEVWQVATGLDAGGLWLTILLFTVMGVGFFLVRLPEELDRVDDALDPERIVAVTAGTPVGQEVARLARERGSELEREVEVRGYERGNLFVTLLVIQGAQVLLLSLSVLAFFLLFGSLVMQESVVAGWIGHPTHHVPGLPNVSVELLQVATFLAAFSGLYVTVTVLTDETYRDQFFTGVMAELERALAVRAAYTLLRTHP
jgi:hypothetical protein